MRMIYNFDTPYFNINKPNVITHNTDKKEECGFSFGYLGIGTVKIYRIKLYLFLM